MQIKNAELAPDLEYIKFWVFDLDNTLYPHGADLFTQVDYKMGLFIQDMFNISYEEAKIRQKHFFMTHG
ncbi:MAG: pyrimidine 5'-nucleotidase, partial [Alphaproteobacteria bacterium]|nr:pyrimidine 5'-nucleotidase [Alphaproteobacteria bacterium]